MLEVLITIIFALMVLIPLGLVIMLLVSAAKQATIHIGTCQKCGYDLHNLGDRHVCPECGHPFKINSQGQPYSQAG